MKSRDHSVVQPSAVETDDAVSIVAGASSPERDPWLSRHDSPVQQKLRRLRPWPVGSVFIERPGMSDAAIREHFRLMKRLGFTCLKQCQVCPGTDQRRVMHMALDEGIIPWWYGDAGFEDPTPELLKSLGIEPDIAPERLREHPKWIERQHGIMRERIDSPHYLKRGFGAAESEAESDAVADVPGVVPAPHFGLPPEAAGPFTAWLREQYGSVPALCRTWNMHHSMVTRTDWTTWEEVEAGVLDQLRGQVREYRRVRDVLRFKADLHLRRIRRGSAAALAADPNVPCRAGGEMSLFLPAAMWGIDMAGIAETIAETGSFYPSMHLAWHFEETDFEIMRPVYIQSSLAADWIKGGWSATWESTGGPQQLSGGKAPFLASAAAQTAGFTVDGWVMTQLMLSWIAAGFRGFGLWSWNTRTAGWEAGEYALLDRNDQPTDRAVAAGRIGAACQRYRDELWQARKQPTVGVLQSWEVDAGWAAISLAGRDHFRSMPVDARIGTARALIDANVPWEFVTPADLAAGLASRYQSLYLPACLMLDEALLEQLAGEVRRGLRVVLDAPGGWYDAFGQLLSTADDSAFEQLFGCRLADVQYSRPGNRAWRIEGQTVEGFTLDLQPTTARVVQSFDHATADHPLPVMTEHQLGEGQAVVLATQAALTCKRPGQTAAQRLLVQAAVGDLPLPYQCEGAICYRLVAPTADHYFLLNDGDPAQATLTPAAGTAASQATDVLTDELVDLSKPVTVPDCSGRWLRVPREEVMP